MDAQLANTIQSMLPATDSRYDPRRAAHDLWKVRGKEWVSKVPDSRRHFILQQAVRTIAALVILREKILRPILAGVGKPKTGRKPKNRSSIDQHYQAVRQDMFTARRRPAHCRVTSDRVLSIPFAVSA
jgi:hypothetical protein